MPRLYVIYDPQDRIQPIPDEAMARIGCKVARMDVGKDFLEHADIKPAIELLVELFLELNRK